MAKKSKFAWLKLPKKTDPEVPLEPPVWMGNHSNGEYFHTQTPREAAMRTEILKRAEEKSRYLGMDRREFLASSMGMFTTMAVINQMGCNSSDTATPAGPTSADGGGGGGELWNPGKGPFVVPPDADCDPGREIDLSGKEFIFDVQTHSFDDGEWRDRNTVYPIFLGLIARCTDEPSDKQLDCMDPKHYGDLMFVESDTTMTVITSWPAASCFDDRDLLGKPAVACGLPLSNAGMRDLRDYLNGLAKSQRVINQIQVMPNDRLEKQIEGMYAAAEDPDWRAGSWKCYPAWRSDTYVDSNGGAQGYFLDDPIGVAFIEAGLKLGIPNFAVHKGLPIPGFDVEHNKPTEMGRVAKMFPEANFVVYHSAIHSNTGVGAVIEALNPIPTEQVPYDNTETDPAKITGVNLLIHTLIQDGVIHDPDDPDTSIKLPDRLNVFAEMGSAWSNVMRDTNQAQHYIGKLLKYLGEDNIVWGTDCILGGSPQAQIELFRSFTITPEYQDKYGYPELTPAIKKKIFGLNAAKFYRIDPEAKRCTIEKGDLAMRQRMLDEELGGRRWTFAGQPLGPRTRREFFKHAALARAKGVPG